MATYTKETALYDTGAIAGDIADAAGQVNKYITSVGSDGIKVHPYNSTTGQADPNNYVVIDSDGLEIFKTDGAASNPSPVSVAEFGESIRIGNEDSVGKVIISEDGFEFYNYDPDGTEWLNMQIGADYDMASTGYQMVPYFILGDRQPGQGTPGSYSASFGEWCNADALGSFAQGSGTTAFYPCSVALNEGTYANDQCQTVIGKYNELSNPYRTHVAFIIGNGTSGSARSNAFSVDFNGNVDCAGNITVHGHSNPIGYTNSGTGTKSLSTGNSAVKISGDLSIGAGTWILIGAVSFPSNATGARNIRWYQDGSDVTTSVVTTPTVTGGYVTRLQSTAIVNSDNNISMAIYGWQNSGSTLSVTYYWRLVRIA